MKVKVVFDKVKEMRDEINILLDTPATMLLNFGEYLSILPILYIVILRNVPALSYIGIV